MSDKSAICLEGGIMAAMGVGYYDIKHAEFRACPAYKAMVEYLGDRLTRVTQPRLYDWNDRNGRTAGEVIEALRGAAAVERAKEAVHINELEGASA